jgi:dCMP deaminase
MLLLWAHVAAARGTCNRLKVGAVISFESRPVSAGYNGAPPGKPHCDNNCNESRPCTNTIHAEENAIKWARTFGIDPKGSTIYLTDSPCNACAERIIDAGIKRVVFDRKYRDERPLIKLNNNGVEWEECRINPVISVILHNLLTLLASAE